MVSISLSTLLLITLLTAPQSAAVSASDQESMPALSDRSLSADDVEALRALYRRLIDAENRHDIAEIVLQHLNDLYKTGPFRIDPDYDREKVVALTHDVAETYVPVSITVAYAGQVPIPKPFLMILEWVRTPDGWRMATDIALPIPPAPNP